VTVSLPCGGSKVGGLAPSLAVVPVGVWRLTWLGGGSLGLAALLLVVSNIISWGLVALMVGSVKSLCVSKSSLCDLLCGVSFLDGGSPIIVWRLTWLGDGSLGLAALLLVVSNIISWGPVALIGLVQLPGW